MLVIISGCLCFPRQVQAALPEPVNSRESYLKWLNLTGRPAYSRYRGLEANYEVYKKYNLLSYGTPANVPGNRYDFNTKQHEAHGYSYDEYVLYNSFFPEDYPSVSDPVTWNRINLGTDAAVSWMRLTSREKSHIKSAPMYYMGKNYNNMNYTKLNLTENKCVVLAIPSMNLGFAVHTNHLTASGSLRYATFHGDGIGGYVINKSLKAKNEPSGKIFILSGGKNYIDIIFVAQMNISSFTGLANQSDIKGGKIIFKNYESYKEGAGPWSIERTVRYHRTNQTNRATSRQISEKNQIQIISAMGDVKTDEAVYNFTIYEEPLYSNNLNASLSMTGEISLFNGSNTLLNKYLPNNNLRFLCLEKVKLQVDFANSALPQTVTFFPAGFAPVTVKTVITSPGSGYAALNYTMGIIPFTLDWENKRIRSPYTAFAHMYINGESKYLTLEGIEITGSVHDLLYLQSKNSQ